MLSRLRRRIGRALTYHHLRLDSVISDDVGGDTVILALNINIISGLLVN